MDGIRDLKPHEVTFRLVIEPEPESVRGNAMSSGDDALDRELEDELIERINCGDVFAWFAATVEASWRSPDGKVYTGVAYLGCCSYRDEAEFRADAYHRQMQEEALEDLNSTIFDAVMEGDRLRLWLVLPHPMAGSIVWGSTGEKMLDPFKE